ncbi:MAG: agmatine deiminase family protein [Pseudomonadota bacterium]|nr:agmatine deiminase family protein [Pseudomonadota bacterium]
MMAAFRMPAEWEPHAATIIGWPHNKNDWPGKFEPIPWVYAEIIRTLAQGERVRLLVQNVREKEKAQDYCGRAGVDPDKLDIHIIPTDRIWMRDSGPIFVRTGKGGKVMLDWRFNAWAKYSNYKRDDKVPAALNEHIGIERIEPVHKGSRVVLEGGSIDVNGKGCLLTTEECLLSKVQERNPGFMREDYEAVFEKYLGVRHVIWLGNGITGDDTHGHVDDLARFVNPTTVVTVMEKNTKDSNHAPLKDNLKRLKSARDQSGKPLTVVELPMPRPLIFEGTQLPASYANFLIANKTVLVPTFNDPADRVALSILAELFPRRDVVGIHAVDLVWGFGTIHCLSQQEPA